MEKQAVFRQTCTILELVAEMALVQSPWRFLRSAAVMHIYYTKIQNVHSETARSCSQPETMDGFMIP